MIIGDMIFTIGSIMCMIAFSISFLIIARFIQGFGSAATIVLFATIISDVYKPEHAGKFYGNLNAILSGVMAGAPILGAFIAIRLGWRGNLGFVFMMSALSTVLIYFFLSETKKKLEKHEFKKITRNYKKLFFSKIFLSAAISTSLGYSCYIAFIALAPFLYMEHYKLSSL